MRNFRNTFLSIVLFLPVIVFAQTTIKGKVIDKINKSELPGVNVVVKGTTNGTVTDFDGLYSINNVNIGDVLVFSFIGYNTLEVSVTSNADINVELDESAESLEEVIIIGYGTTTVKDATGSVAAISAEDFNEGNIVTPASLISGRVAGVTVTTDGAPGGGSAIRIRGGASLGASNDPLIVIDGLPISNSSTSGSRSVLASINPDDIASFSILKDASATAIYGSRASNGVIIITTKKGKTGELQVSWNTKVGYQTLADKIEVFSADEYRTLIADRVALGQSGISVEQLGTASTDWQDEIYEETLTVDNSFSMGGLMFGKLPARFSMGYTNQPGLRRTSRFERGSTTLSLNPKFFDEHLKVNLKANLNIEKNRFAAGVEGSALYFDPTQPVYDETSPFGGFFEYHNNGEPLNAPRNPVATLLQRRDISVVNRFFGNLEFDYKFHFLPELRAIVNIGYDNSNGHGDINVPTTSINGFRTGNNTPFLGTEENYSATRLNKLLDGYLAYNKDFDDVNLEVTAGYSYQKFESERFSSSNLRDPDTESDVATDPDIVLIGLFGRANISLMDKYLLTLSYRRDGTSRFSEDNRWGDFPAAAFGWKLSEEDFLKDSDVISDLKLRLGWGITGQQDIEASYAYLGRYITGSSTSQYILGNSAVVVGIPQSKFEDIKWEETTTYNIGLDYGLFNDKFTGSLEVYLKESKDLLANVAVSDGSNFSNAGWQNIGKFTSKGIEFAVGSDIVNNEDLKWNVNYNINLNRTEIDELAFGQDIEVGGIAGGTGSRIQVHREGFAPYSYYVYKQLYDASGDPIEGAYADINQDGIINSSDRYIYKKPNADINMGLQSRLDYKNFDFTFNLRANIGNYMYNNVNSNGAQYNLLQAVTALGNLPVSVLESNFNETANVLISDYYIENASFIKMDNVNLGYTFDEFKRESLSIRLSTGVQNVFTITNYSGLDPEVFNGIDNTIYPRARTFLMGVNIKF
jgi:iron complex outermembrane receptor protein